MKQQPGTLIISLDFELHWGVFGFVGPNSPYMKNLHKTPAVINRILEVFEKKEISATWAIVGFLFAESSDMLKNYEPAVKSVYPNVKSNPYLLKTGLNEIDDPIHFALSIIRKIQSVPGQEIATHTFSHFLCREEGATIEAFQSDLDSAIRIALNFGIKINSIVFPRNQLIKEFIDILPEKGIKVFRGAEKGWMYSKIRHVNERGLTRLRLSLNRFGRILDTYLPLTGFNDWSRDEPETQKDQPVNVPASRFIRPYNPKFKYLDWLKFIRIKNQIKHAARNGKMVHLHSHPHNFGSDIEENMKLLNKILDCFDQCRLKYNMKSMTMYEYSEIIRNNYFQLAKLW